MRKTPYYDLNMFEAGDAYLSSADRRRFYIIDNQLEFLASQIGDGVISGWNISLTAPNTIEVTEGLGVIDNFVTNTYGHYSFTLDHNKLYYFYVKRKPNILSSRSAFSAMASVSYTDTIPPAHPTGVHLSEIAYNYVKLSWSKNTEPDIDYYAIWRSLDGSTYTKIAETKNNRYTDENVVHDTVYYYAIVAHDTNGLASYDLSHGIISPGFVLGDMNGDGLFNNQDVGPFILALTNYAQYEIEYPGLDGINRGDINRDGVLNNQDNALFTDLLIRGQTVIINDTQPVIILAHTPFDNRVPSDPEFVEIINGDQTLEVIWDAAAFLADYYLITIQPIDYEGNDDGIATEYSVDSSKQLLFIEGLTNGQTYKINVQSVSHTGVRSNGISVIGQPVATSGAQQIRNLTWHDEAVDSSGNVAINITWEIQSDSYLPPPAYYVVTVVKDNETGDPSIYNEESITLYRYTINNEGRKIYENTKYIIKIQTVTADGVLSAPFILRLKTRKFTPPGPVTNVNMSYVYDIVTRKLTATWKNTLSDFAYNSITIKRISIDSSSSSSSSPQYIEQDLNCGKAEKYDFKKTDILNHSIYTIIIKTYDSYGNVSTEASTSLVINVTLDTAFISGVGDTGESRPPAVSALSVFSGNGEVSIYWEELISDNISNYCVWRSDYKYSYNSSDFKKLIELDRNARKYTDYDVTNGNVYVYFVTTKDIFGKESLNPADDNYISYPYVIAEPREFGADLTVPPVINISTDGNNVVLSWAADTESFDGYEIYKSVQNKSSFTKIDVVDSLSTGYVDVNGLHQSGTYYYMIRKFREEAEIVYTNKTTNVPLGAIIIGAINTYNNSITIDNDVKYSLNLLEDPIKKEVQRQFSVPTHLYYNTNDDRRVRLADSLKVVDWTTKDYKEYFTKTDIRGTSNYIVYVNGVQTTLHTYIDTTTGTLTFEDYIVEADEVTNENPAPTISVVFTNTEETSGTLPVENIGDIFANKVSKGKLLPSTLEQIDHFGRLKETCNLLKTVANRQSGNEYQINTPVGTSFYDLILLNTGQILAATNNGVQISSTEDISEWNLKVNRTCTKLFYSETYAWYFALCVDKIYYTEDLLKWFEVKGITGASFIQDITEDESGNIYVSSNSGVYRLNPNEFLTLQWQQCKEIDPLNNSTYALLWYDNKLFASLESGVYYTMDNGGSWILFDEISVPLYHLIELNDTLFGCSNNKIWRKSYAHSQLTTVATFSFSIRKLVIFNDTLYVTTDKGLYQSTATSNIYTNSKLDFEFAFFNIIQNGIIPPIFAMRLMNGRLYLGTDERILSVTSKRVLYTHVDIPGTNIFIYHNGVEKNVGVFWGYNKIIFDTRTNPLDTVEVVKEYTTYYAKNGGWANVKYDADITLIINGEDQLPSIKPPTTASVIAPILKSIVLPVYDPRTSSFEEANKYLKLIVQTIDAIDTISYLTPNENIDYTQIVLLMNYIDLFKANLHPELRDTIIVPPMEARGTTNSGYKYTVDVFSGKITVSTGLNKYTNLQISVKDVGILNTGELTHRQIDDKLELVNSGLPAHLASVQQSNLIKLGIHDQIIDPLGLEESRLHYQSKFYAGCDPWYDKFNSTIDYTTQLDLDINANSSFSINYPSDVTYVSTTNTVWVCGQGGIIGINANDYTTFSILRLSDAYFFNMHLNEGYIYALSDEGLYSINASTYEYVKMVDMDILSGATSVLRFSNTTYLATSTGLYYRRDYDLDWKLLFEIKNAFVRASQQITFCAGQNPTATKTISEVYYSTGGVNWNRSNQFEDIIINAITQRYDSVYYATDQGMIVEDLSGLFSGRGAEITAVDLDDDGKVDQVIVNSVDSDNDKVIAAKPNGQFYQLSGSTVMASGQSSLNIIHKVKVVNGKYWLFADNLIEIEGLSRLVQVSTGKTLI